MKSQIVTEVITLSGIHEIKHFEIRIPENTSRIVGIEFGVRFSNSVLIDGSIDFDESFIEQFDIADLRLQGASSQTWFYAERIKDSIKQMDGIDFYTENTEMNIPFEYHGKREIEILNIIPTTTRIKGFIKDVIGGTLQTPTSYSITICLHLELHS